MGPMILGHSHPQVDRVPVGRRTWNSSDEPTPEKLPWQNQYEALPTMEMIRMSAPARSVMAPSAWPADYGQC
jgi:hypothetical protein